ncbi:MAG: NEW3 domain-containing protein [Anaerolineae bacterium]|nr:MAG: NEW3 domain-containing protein [Anaerolineae bacterium]
MSRIFVPAVLLAAMLSLSAGGTDTAWAEEPTGLSIVTEFPAQAVGIGDSVSLKLVLRSQAEAQVANLEVLDLPEGWSANFRDGSRVVLSAYVEPGKETDLKLRIETADDTGPGEYTLRVRAQGDGTIAVLPITLMVENRLPPSLAFDVELPVLRGKPDSTLRYSVTLKNEGGEDLLVDLQAEAPPFYQVIFKNSGQEVTSLPLEVDQSERMTVEVDPLFAGIPAGNFPITLFARGGEAEAILELEAEVVGQSTLSITTPDGRLSGRLQAEEETPIKLLVKNTGSAAAHGIKLNASEPRGWTVTFEPELIKTIDSSKQVEVTASVTPAEKALAGDYMLTFRAQPESGASTSVEYRATVRTSTLWGLVGIGLIAAAVGVVGIAVTRFGRR